MDNHFRGYGIGMKSSENLDNLPSKLYEFVVPDDLYEEVPSEGLPRDNF